MNSRFRALLVLSAVWSLVGCDKPKPQAAVDLTPAPVMTETDNQLAEARDALQRQAMEIETKSALMDKQLADMEQVLKERENTELRGSLDTLKRQNEALRAQADAARQQSDAITQRIAIAPSPNVAPPPVLQPDYSVFYDGLAPYGRWFDVNGYGYCWRPTITVAGWRPYVDGSWVWSSLGWAWQSNEAFGWATYHYGRWVNLASYGWVWVPGSEWAPAWVAWRQSRECVGWAPLPPEPGLCTGVYRDCDSRYGLGPTSYIFINTNQFVSSSYISVYAPVTQQTTIFQHSVNVTQIVPRSGHGRGHGFVNQGGPPRGQMEQACGRPVPQRQVQTMHADQLPAHQQHPRGGRREAAAHVAMVELPALTPGSRVRHPDIKDRIQRPAVMGGFEGVPQRVATEIRETIAKEKETAAVQQQPVHGRFSHGSPRRPGGAPAGVNVPPVLNTPTQETVRPAVAAETPGTSTPPSAGVAVEQTRPSQAAGVTSPTRGMPQERGGERHRSRDGRPDAPLVAPAVPAVVENKAAEAAVGAAPATVIAPPAAMPRVSGEQASANGAGERVRGRSGEDQTQGAAMQHRQRRDLEERAEAEKRAAEQAAIAAEAEKTRMQANAPQQPEATPQQQRIAAEQAAAETEKGRQQAEAAAQQQRMATEQTTAETEKARQQAEALAQQQRMTAEQAAAEIEKGRQQAEAAAQQQRMAAEQTAAETEKARQQAEAIAQQQRMAAEQAAAMQQQQELAAQQQRAAAERMANEQAAAEAARVQQAQAEAAAMQRQQDEARRAAEEQQMRAQQEAAQRAAQEMAQRQADEQARRQQEAEMQRAQEQARRAAEEQMRAQQEMAQRQAEEQARRQQEAEMQRAQEQARRAAEEQMRAQQEAAQRAAQEMAQRQAEERARRAAEEQARRAQEEAQRAAAEAAQRAAAGAGAGGR